MSALLEIDHLSIAFSGLRALERVSFEVREGEILGLIGPNGAGKSTLLNCVSRVHTPTAGDVRYRGESVLARPIHELPALGIRRTFQNLELFRDASARENVILGAAFRHRGAMVWDLLGNKREAEAAASADRLLEELSLSKYAHTRVSALPYGIQKAVELARALASEPKLLLLDEPTAGMNPGETAGMTSLIKRLRDELDLTVLLIEHDMKVVMGISERITVLDHGELLAEGTPEEIRANPSVIEAYLGKQATHQ